MARHRVRRRSQDQLRVPQVCGEQARWGTRKGPAFSYVCDYHRRVYEATGTFWNDAGY